MKIAAILNYDQEYTRRGYSLCGGTSTTQRWTEGTSAPYSVVLESWSQ